MSTRPPGRPPAPKDPPASEPRPPRRRRGRRRGGQGDAARGSPARPAPIVPEVSRLAAAGAAADTLNPDEVREMKEHLAFLRRHKHLLRLKLNAAEDLLVNGQREPSERGVCRHLIGKVDRSVIDAAIAREPLHSDAAARARMLAGAIRLTADLGILLAYLETLAHVRAHAEAAQAFAEVVQRIDFESVSPARLGRLLQVLIETFTDHERVQVLFSLLDVAAFRRAFDTAASAFPPAVAEVMAPLRTVHRRLLEREPEGEARALLARGLTQVLSAPDPVLRGYPEALRAGMLELALDPSVPPALGDRAAGVLLSSLPRNGRTYARLSTRRAAQLLRRHDDDRARAALEELRRTQPGVRLAERWLFALDARRLGRVAIAGQLSERGRLVAGFWLDGQRTVWMRTAAASDAARLATEARQQADLALPAVAPVVEHGVAAGIPYVAVSAPGNPLTLDASRPFAVGAALVLAAAAARVLRALALAGVTVPDAEPERFLLAPAPAWTLTIADLDGARPADVIEAARAHAALAAGLASRLLPPDTYTRLDPEQAAALRRTLEAPADLPALIARLDQAAVRAARE